jgi:hypothetical protein
VFKMPIKVGEHFIKVLCHSDQFLNFLKNNFQLVSDTRYRTLDITIQLKDGYGVSFTNYDVEITKLENHISYRRADYLIEVDNEFGYALVSVYDELALKHALMNLYSAFIVHHNWGVLLHSSCAIDNNRAHIFSGQSGAGKSTAARLSAPRDLLSDEATIVKITSEEITVFNSPFRSEIKSKTIVEPQPLESIQLLNQALQNNRVKLKKSDALIQLLDKVFYWAHSPEETVRIFNLLNKLVETVPVYELYFQKNDRFWELIS